jgi:hypothetical protein
MNLKFCHEQVGCVTFEKAGFWIGHWIYWIHLLHHVQFLWLRFHSGNLTNSHSYSLSVFHSLYLPVFINKYAYKYTYICICDSLIIGKFGSLL